MERLQDKRFWLGGGALGALLILAVGWFMFIGPEMSSASDLRSQAAATRQQNALLQLKVTALQQKSIQLPQYTSSLKTALATLPFDSGMPAFTRQLSAQAKANQVTITSVIIGAFTAISAGATTPAAGATDPTTATPTTGATASTPTTAAVGTTTAAGGLYSAQVTIQSTGTLVHQLGLLNDIRTVGPRRALLTSVQLTPGAGAKVSSIDGSAAFSTQLTVFSAPQSAAQIAELKKLLSGKIGN